MVQWKGDLGSIETTLAELADLMLASVENFGQTLEISQPTLAVFSFGKATIVALPKDGGNFLLVDSKGTSTGFLIAEARRTVNDGE